MAYVSSFEQIGIEKGIQKGIQKGRQEGRQTGEALSLQRLLTKRFGPLQPSMIATIDGATLSDIEAWFDKAIDAPSLSDVFAD